MSEVLNATQQDRVSTNSLKQFQLARKAQSLNGVVTVHGPVETTPNYRPRHNTCILDSTHSGSVLPTR